MKKRKKKLTIYYKKEVLRYVFSQSQKHIDDIVINIGPLKNGDKMFVESANPNDPRLLMSTTNSIYFEQGYASTAIFLLNVVEYGKNYLRKDSYIYPALFCIRMYLEIIMKLILKNNYLDCKEGHDLSKLWEKVKSILDVKDEEQEVVEQLVLELQTFDPVSTAFRYPKTLNDIYNNNKKKTGVTSIFIDVKNLQRRFLQLYRFFDGIYELSIRNTDNNQ